MRMMSSGTCEPRPQGAAATEMAAKLAQMQAERGRQDQMWQATTVTSEKTTYASSTSDIVKTNNAPRLY
jgi:hypothetical protein